MDALKFPPVPSPRREIQTLRPTNQAGRGYSLHAHPSPDHIRPFRNTHKRTSRPPTFKIAPTELRGLGGNNNRADEGPKVPCGFKKKKKKKKRRPSSRPVDYCLGKPEISGAPEPPLSFRVTAAHTHPEAPAAAYRDIFRRKKILLTYSRLSIQVFSHFPLSFHSAVAPCAPPPLHCGPSSGCPLGAQACETPRCSHNTFVITAGTFLREPDSVMSQSEVVQ